MVGALLPLCALLFLLLLVPFFLSECVRTNSLQLESMRGTINNQVQSHISLLTFTLEPAITTCKKDVPEGVLSLSLLTMGIFRFIITLALNHQHGDQ